MEIIEIEKECRTNGEFYTVDQFVQAISEHKNAEIEKIEIDCFTKLVRQAYGKANENGTPFNVNWNTKGVCRRSGNRKPKFDLYL